MEEDISETNGNIVVSFVIIYVVNKETPHLPDPSLVMNDSPPSTEDFVVVNDLRAIKIEDKL